MNIINKYTKSCKYLQFFFSIKLVPEEILLHCFNLKIESNTKLHTLKSTCPIYITNSIKYEAT
jgi:hypothetical protein